MNIRPIPDAHGVGFTSAERLPQLAGAYREEQVGRHWNYYVTPDNWNWPVTEPAREGELVIDGFSPNLNKSLHVGHLRNLAVANSLRHILRVSHETEFVALLGTDGLLRKAQDELRGWFEFLKYQPTVYYDALMPKDEDIVPRRPGDGPYEGALVWDGPKGPVVVFRKPDESGHRRPTYAFHDLAFAKTVGPTHYITGCEQKEHFEGLGLGDRHLAMGLVLGLDGKKLKSRTGDALSAAEAMGQVSGEILKGQAGVEKGQREYAADELKKLSWNILCWNFLHCARSQNVKFDPEKWTKPDSGGMYISYTYARVCSALAGLGYLAYPEPPGDVTQADADLLGYAGYAKYYHGRAVQQMDPAPLANYALDLARRLGRAYHTEQIRDGRQAFQYAVTHAGIALKVVMNRLGMFTLENV